MPVFLSQHKEMRQDLEERRGIECKLCSQCFVEGQTLRVTDRNGRGRPDLGISNSLAGEQILAENGDKEVPAFGYQVSMQMACKLVEIYRDAKFPLSLIAKDILLDYGSVVDLPKDNGPRGASLDDAEPNRPGGSEPMVSGGVGLKKKRTGWMLVCYHCFTILEEHHYYQHTSDKLYKAFGIDSVNSNSAMSGDHGKAAGASQRPRSANKARRSASDSALPTAPSRAVLNKPNGDFSTQCMRYGHPEPWTRSALERYHVVGAVP